MRCGRKKSVFFPSESNFRKMKTDEKDAVGTKKPFFLFRDKLTWDILFVDNGLLIICKSVHCISVVPANLAIVVGTLFLNVNMYFYCMYKDFFVAQHSFNLSFLYPLEWFFANGTQRHCFGPMTFIFQQSRFLLVYWYGLSLIHI